MIDIKIFQVEQGFCAAIELGSRHTILIDCGSSHQFKPAQYIWQRKHCEYLDYLILPAYTKDHLSGFDELVNQFYQHDIPIHFLVFNPSLNLEQLSDLKPFPLPLNNSLKNLKDQSQTIEIEDLKLTFFENKSANNEHDLSLVTFIQDQDINMILPADLEKEGWLKLLESESFRANLEKVNIFVASNHGREIGYCEEVFNYCHPEVIIVSNKENQPLSDEMMQRYSEKAKGTISGISKKKIITTYDEGTIVVSKYLDCLRHIVTQKQTNSSIYC